ncbi:MAG TPA: L-serine ammonia-lyase [Cytophagaceae bacterium]
MNQHLSVFDMLKIGIGPSSSHTLGPWKACRDWGKVFCGREKSVKAINVYLYGSLALTGKGHYTDKAVVLGLSGYDPETIPLLQMQQVLDEVSQKNQLYLTKDIAIPFDITKNICFYKDQSLPYHPNALKLEIQYEDGVIDSSVYYSIGGGFIVKAGPQTKEACAALPVSAYTTAKELSEICRKKECRISDIVLKNELIYRTESEVRSGLLRIWEVMKEAAYEGCHKEGVLPGGLNVKRRAFDMNKQLLRVHNYSTPDEWLEAMKVGGDFHKVIMRVSCIAIAVNEVNASMGRIVTAPTNGSAGVIPAVLFYYVCFSGQRVEEEDIIRFLLTAAEIGKFFKIGATISAAAGGCQAEIGVSSSMAAAALTECLGGSPDQALMAAEIAAEHHLGLTCDPIGGLVQIPCIERNSMGAVKAITASMIALASDPASAKVSLDNVIKTMKETAENMHSKYKETSLGGLAVNVGVNVPEC